MGCQTVAPFVLCLHYKNPWSRPRVLLDPLKDARMLESLFWLPFSPTQFVLHNFMPALSQICWFSTHSPPIATSVHSEPCCRLLHLLCECAAGLQVGLLQQVPRVLLHQGGAACPGPAPPPGLVSNHPRTCNWMFE